MRSKYKSTDRMQILTIEDVLLRQLQVLVRRLQVGSDATAMHQRVSHWRDVWHANDLPNNHGQ